MLDGFALNGACAAAGAALVYVATGNNPYFALAAFAIGMSGFLFWSVLNTKGGSQNSDTVSEGNSAANEVKSTTTGTAQQLIKSVPKSLRILFGTTTGKSQSLAAQLENLLKASLPSLEVDVDDLNTYDQDNLEQEEIVVFLVSTWTGGMPPASSKVFFQWLDDIANDFRVSKTHLQNTKYAVLGLGNAEYDDDYAAAGRTIDSLMETLGAERLVQFQPTDDNIDVDSQFAEWASELLGELEVCCGKVSSSVDEDEPKKKKGSRAARREKMKKKLEEDGPVEVTEEDRINDQFLTVDQLGDDDQDSQDGEVEKKEATIGDLEDLGNMVNLELNSDREMVTPAQRKSLTKEGYRIIGTHSAVKLCRWTKHQLRGRGGCYKHTCYGITSYQCMEATPSLACANKCVFCWRHHKNPVGRSWRWRTDEPGMIVDEAVKKHQGMIKELRGLPGLRMSRWNEAFTVKHCALSLVGEPIMYPRINEMIADLHRRSISTFLVTNAQFPDKIRELDPVTQLYVSIDASNRESLKAIDRPLFKDFWERFVESLKELKNKGQRTVYRLTLVKKWNMSDDGDNDELEEYAKLIEIGQPDFIEIKAVTYCGKSDGSDLTMENVPWHTEVRKFSEALCAKIGDSYGLACEHSHSCLTLLAKSQYKIDGNWHTWINYERFHELVEAGEPFVGMDYVAPTPSWAVWGASEEGFDPEETRFHRTRGGKVKVIEYQSTESGCG